MATRRIGSNRRTTTITTGLVTLRHSSGTTILPMLAFHVADLPGVWSGYDMSCRSGNYPGAYVYFCSSPDFSDVYMGRDLGDASYTVSGGVYSGWLNPSVQEWVAFGPTYTAELRYEVNGIARENQLVVPLRHAHIVSNDTSPRCSYRFYPMAYQVYCQQWQQDLVEVYGEEYFF